jgi:hypothetical protein
MRRYDKDSPKFRIYCHQLLTTAASTAPRGSGGITLDRRGTRAYLKKQPSIGASALYEKSRTGGPPIHPFTPLRDTIVAQHAPIYDGRLKSTLPFK